MGVTLESVQNKFSFMVGELCNEPDVLSQFAVWLDLRLAEYKLKGNMTACLNEDPGLPIWLKGLKTHIFNTAGVKPRTDNSNFQRLPLPGSSLVSNTNVCANFEDLSSPQTLSTSDIPVMQNSPDVSFSVSTCDLDVKQEPLFPLDAIPVKHEPQTIFPVSLFTNEQSDKFRLQELNLRTQGRTRQQHRRKKQTVDQRPKYRSRKSLKSNQMSLSKVPNSLESSQKSAEMGDNPADVLELSPPSLPIVTESNIEAGVTDYCNLSNLSDLDNEIPPRAETDIDGEQEPRGNYGSYTVDQKKKALKVLESTSLRRASMCLGIPRSTISTWRRQLEVGKEETVKRPRGRGVTYDKHVDFEIRDWVLAQQNNHRGISRQAISEYARQKVNRPGFRAKDGWLQKFLKRHNLTLNFTRGKTQQQNSKEMQKKIDKFNQQLSMVWRNSTFDHVINMDEIFVTFPHKPSKIIDGKCKSIKNIDDGIEVKPLTIVLAIDTKGQMLPPLVIFKGESLPSDIESVYKGVHFRLQENGHMTEELMADWLDTVLLPHTEKKSTLLIIDSYEAHTSPVITKKVYELNVTSVIIPGGCIQRLQPLDASINSPFRYHVRKYWEEYKKANPDLVKGKSQDVSREVMLDCVLRAWNYMNNKKRSIVISFRVTGISDVLAKAKDLPEISETVEETAEEAAAEIMVDTSMDESWLSDSSDMEDFPGFTATDSDN